jgi:hypothetical protein
MHVQISKQQTVSEQVCTFFVDLCVSWNIDNDNLIGSGQTKQKQKNEQVWRSNFN